MTPTDYLGPVLALLGMFIVYGVAMGFFRRQDPNRARFAKLRMSSLTGPNAGVVLAALIVTQLYYLLFSDVSSTTALWGFIAAVGAIFIVVGLSRRGERLVEFVGVVAFVAIVMIQEGPEAGMGYLVAAVALLIVLSLARFLFGK